MENRSLELMPPGLIPSAEPPLFDETRAETSSTTNLSVSQRCAEYSSRLVDHQSPPPSLGRSFKWSVQPLDTSKTFRSSQIGRMSVSNRTDSSYAPFPSAIGSTPSPPIPNDITPIEEQATPEKELHTKPKKRLHHHKPKVSLSSPLPITLSLSDSSVRLTTSSDNIAASSSSSPSMTSSSGKKWSSRWRGLAKLSKSQSASNSSRPSLSSLKREKGLQSYQKRIYSILRKTAKTFNQPQEPGNSIRRSFSSSSSSRSTAPKRNPEEHFKEIILPSLGHLLNTISQIPQPDEESHTKWLTHLKRQLNKVSQSKSIFELQCIIKEISFNQPETAELILNAIHKNKVEDLQERFFFYELPKSDAETLRLEKLGKINLETGALRSFVKDGTYHFNTISVSNGEGKTTIFKPSKKKGLDANDEQALIRDFVRVLKENGYRSGEWGGDTEVLDNEARNIHESKEAFCSNVFRAISVGALAPAVIFLRDFIKIKDCHPYKFQTAPGCFSELHIDDPTTFTATIPKRFCIERDCVPIAYIDIHWTVKWDQMIDLRKGYLGVHLQFTDEATPSERKTIESDWKNGSKLRKKAQIAICEKEPTSEELALGSGQQASSSS